MEDNSGKKTGVPLNFDVVYLLVSGEKEKALYTRVEISLTPYFEIRKCICTYTLELLKTGF